MHFRLLQICVPEAPEPRSCSSRRCPEEDVMLRTFILAGCVQPSGGSGECYRRESAEHQQATSPAGEGALKKLSLLSLSRVR